jgi:methionine--tRNA ligase beta chain
MITFKDFQKLDLRIAKIIQAERVEGSSKLIKLVVDLGEDFQPSTRQIIAGIGKTYQPEDLLEKEIVVLANLEPKTILGLESQGMLLAAEDEESEKPIFLKPAEPVSPGSKIH